MDTYHHSHRTGFTAEDVQAAVGKSATLTLEGAIVGWDENENGAYVLFEIDERFGFGPQRFGLDLELLKVSEDSIPEAQG